MVIFTHYFAKKFVGEEMCKYRTDISGYWIFKRFKFLCQKANCLLNTKEKIKKFKKKKKNKKQLCSSNLFFLEKK